MERLFTSITNAGATATQNKNIMQTGYYAGEREDFMRENLFMTETTMAPVKIAGVPLRASILLWRLL